MLGEAGSHSTGEESKTQENTVTSMVRCLDQLVAELRGSTGPGVVSVSVQNLPKGKHDPILRNPARDNPELG